MLTIRQSDLPPADIDMLYVKMCEDQRSYPIFGLYSKLTKTPTLEFLYERLNLSWCNIIAEIITRETDSKLFIKKLIMRRNDIRDEGFAEILKGCLS